MDMFVMIKGIADKMFPDHTVTHTLGIADKTPIKRPRTSKAISPSKDS